MHINTRFNLGDDIYFMDMNRIDRGKIVGIVARVSNKTSIEYFVTSKIHRNFPFSIFEENAFFSKEELIKSL